MRMLNWIQENDSLSMHPRADKTRDDMRNLNQQTPHHLIEVSVFRP